MNGGSVTLLRPDGTPYPGSPFKSGGLPGPWAVVVDGNDNVWISNFAMPSSPIVELCGVRTEHCPPGVHTGDQISPPGGYVGGGLQMQTDLGIDPAGNVWVMNNWQDIDSCIGTPKEALSTRCGGQGVTIFYGMAKPVRAPQIGPAQAVLIACRSRLTLIWRAATKGEAFRLPHSRGAAAVGWSLETEIAEKEYDYSIHCQNDNDGVRVRLLHVASWTDIRSEHDIVHSRRIAPPDRRTPRRGCRHLGPAARGRGRGEAGRLPRWQGDATTTSSGGPRVAAGRTSRPRPTSTRATCISSATPSRTGRWWWNCRQPFQAPASTAPSKTRGMCRSWTLASRARAANTWCCHPTTRATCRPATPWCVPRPTTP